MKFNRRNLITKFIYIFLLLLFYFFRIFKLFSEELNTIIAYLVILTSAILIYKSRKYLPLFLMAFFIGYSNYSIAYIVYIKKTPPDVLYNQITDSNIYGIAIAAILIFNVILITSDIWNRIGKTYTSYNSYNQLLSIGIIIILIAIFIFGYDRSGVASIRSSSTPIYEYSLILFILLFYYSSRNFLFKICYTVVIIAFTFQSFLTGNRVEAISFVFSYIIYHYDNKINYKIIIPFLVVGIFFMVLIGEYRSELTFSISSISATLSNMIDNGFTFNTAYWAFFPSLCIIEMTSYVNIFDKLYLFIQSIKYIFIGSIIRDSSLVSYARNFYSHSMGNVSIIYYYFWFKEIGFLIFSIIIVKYLRIYRLIKSEYINEKYKKIFYNLLLIYVISTTPRWYLYSPFILLRGVLIFSICFIIFYYFDILTKRKRIKR